MRFPYPQVHPANFSLVMPLRFLLRSNGYHFPDGRKSMVRGVVRSLYHYLCLVLTVPQEASFFSEYLEARTWLSTLERLL